MVGRGGAEAEDLALGDAGDGRARVAAALGVLGVERVREVGRAGREPARVGAEGSAGGGSDSLAAIRSGRDSHLDELELVGGVQPGLSLEHQ